VLLAFQRREHDEMYRQRSESFQHLSFAHIGQCTASELRVPLAFERRTHDEMYGSGGGVAAGELRAHGPMHGQGGDGAVRV
jgi:hypothetical protein